MKEPNENKQMVQREGNKIPVKVVEGNAEHHVSVEG